MKHQKTNKQELRDNKTAFWMLTVAIFVAAGIIIASKSMVFMILITVVALFLLMILSDIEKEITRLENLRKLGKK